MAVISFPIPPYSNVPIEPQYYSPRQYYISNVALGITTIVTTVVNHDYVVSQQIRLIIPPSFGCRQLNGQTGYVLSIPNTNQVEVSINSYLNVDNFIASSASTQPQILAIGDIDNGVVNTNGILQQITYIPGSFQNISPN